MERINTVQDISIVGGGLSSSLLAIECKRKNPNLNITILELSKTGEMPSKVGESTSDISAIFFRRFQIEHLLHKHIQKSGLRFFFEDKIDLISEFSSPSYKSIANGFQLDRKVFDEDLLNYAKTLGVNVLRGAKYLNYIECSPLEHLINYNYNDAELDFRSKWIVDASGRKGLVTKKLGWREDVVSLNTASSWGVYSLEKFCFKDPVDNVDWNNLSIGAKINSTTHFMGEGFWAWQFPINDKELSFGIVYDKSHFNHSSPKDVYEQVIRESNTLDQTYRNRTVENFKHLNHLSYKSSKIIKPGIAIIGDACAFIDPLFSPGMEIICQQISVLSDLLAFDLSYKNNKKFTKYECDFLKTIHTRMTLYENRYKIMGESDLFTCITRLDFFGYYTFHVLPIAYFPGMIKNFPKFNTVTEFLYKSFQNRIVKIYNNRKSESRLASFKKEIKFSKLKVPNFYLAPFKILEIFIIWLYSYLLIEIDEFKSRLLKQS